MTGRRTARRIFVVAAIVTLVVAVVGFIVTIMLNAFVLDKYNAYGEVPIPGTSSLHLPAGEATVSFHVQTIGSSSGGGLPVPPLGLTIVPPEGVSEPQVTENYGTTTSVNNDTHIRVWVAQIPADGTYDITTSGEVNGYINPQLAFGHATSYGWLVWAFAGLFVVGFLGLALSITWAVRAGRAPRAPSPSTIHVGDAYPVSDPYSPSADGVRIEQLKNLAALRDSGALTEEEFQAEKRRILND
jgi:Short C-terminal domain